MLDAPLVERELLRRAACGDGEAFAALVARHSRVVWGVCLRITGNHADAEDAVQDSLVAAWRHLGSFRGEALFSTWLYRIATNAALATVRGRKDTDDLPDEVEMPGTSFDARVATKDAVARALDTLPDRFRAALVLREYGGMTYAEIAEHERISIETVKSRIHRARAIMRTAFEPAYALAG